MNDAVDVLRHGWQDAAGIFAPESPEIAELLQARLEMAVANSSLDENHLLGAIDDVESMAASTGSPAGQALARRLRRTVYEYLLALDAAPPPTLAVKTPAEVAPDAGTEEVAALGHRASSPQEALAATAEPKAAAAPAVDVAPAATPTTDDDEVEASGESPERRSRFGLRRRQGGADQDEDLGSEPDTDGDAAAHAATGQAEAAAPAWQHEPATETPVTAAAPAGPQPAAATPTPPAQASSPPAAAEVAATEAVVASEAAGADAGAEHPDGFVAPKTGFHIVEDTHPTHAPVAATESPLQMPAFAEPQTETTPPASPAHVDSDLATYEWTRPVAPAPPPAPAPAAPEAEVQSAALPAVPAAAIEHSAEDDSEIDSENGWRIRRGAPPKPNMDEDPFENNPKLAELRRRIDERLRRKRCDEAAALLQELAQETGGRVVAELAMNAGDRCQSLGKSNAALNCYLAGSRADPVYELPLSRLADICIDDQDTDLAVSYLERIARLYRFRGDDKAALRVYRRIATIAPYREDVLTVLLNAQNTGRFES